MSAIFKREFKGYFTSPIGYIVLAMLFAVSGIFFFVYNLAGGLTDLSYVYNNTYFFLAFMLLVLPVLTMRLLSDDKRQRTDQALLTAPVSLTGIVLGKFLAALLIIAIGLGMLFVYAIVLAANGVTLNWIQICGNYLGLMLLGGMVISIGLLISSLTESQLIAALGTAVVSLCLLLLDSLVSMVSSNEVLATIVNFLSVNNRYNNFAIGVIQYDDIVFFVSMQALFLFLTVRILDRKRWN